MIEHVTHTVGSLTAAHGGPSRSVTALCDALAQEGSSVNLIATQERPGLPTVLPSEGNVTVQLVPGSERRGYWRPRATPYGQAIAWTASGASGGGVVHDHGVWLPTNRTASLIAQRAGLPLVVSPKGMLSEWALRAGALKKRVAWAAYQQRALRRAAAFSVTSESEAEDVRRLGLRQPVAVIPHGVVTPPAGALRIRHEGGVRTALFLSRIHPKKGLPHLVAAWASVRPADWRLQIVGPEDAQHGADVRRLVHENGLGDEVTFVGEVGDDEKWALYGAADLFILPTLSENFGIVVAEALAAGTPVLTTHEAPWRALEEEGCGWWVEPGTATIGRALAEATALPAGALQVMGERGRAYVETHLSWGRSAREHLALYRWLLGRGSRPACLVSE